ncbi:hypothetical protein JCM6882_006423 [Rhodosporidiobolus microsporus]
MSAIAAFASPFGALHHAHPSTASSHTPFSSLFSKKTSSTSSSSKRSSTSASSSSSSGAKKPALQISYPVLQSTSNRDLPAATPLYSAAPPASFSATHHSRSSSLSSTSSSATSSRSTSPPPPYRSRASFLDLEDDFPADVDGEVDAHPVLPSLDEKALVDMEVVEARMHSWDVERLQQADARLVSELRRMGF